MTRTVKAFLMIGCLLFAVDGNGAMSGNDWKQLRLGEQQAYVWGVVDTWTNFTQAIEPSGKPSSSEVLKMFTDLTRCVRKGLTYGQMVAIVQKYMENNPSQWHFAMASLVWTAIDEACGFKGK